MYAPDDSIIRWRGSEVPRVPVPAEYTVYLLHFDEPYKHAKHYLGFTCNLTSRLQLHRSGNGARLMEVIAQAGIGFEVARLWKIDSWMDGRDLERKLKRRHEGPRLCPICQHKPQDAAALLFQGHFPFHLFQKPGGRQRTNEQVPCFGKSCRN